ncbi:MAG: quinone oxidoreductase [Chromatiales bacterium]|nr:quinone oxidoreductase [Chromatiales bacterium]
MPETGAIVVESFGGPDKLRWVQRQLPEPGPAEVLVRHTAVGLNFIDTYHRSGLYPLELPAGLGTEAAGVVEAVGAAVGGLAPGDRVAYVCLPPGAYAERRVLPVDRLVKLPEAIGDEVAAAAMLKGLTAWYLLHRSYRLQAGDPVLVHAAAGGVGLILCQWARALGARVIGVVGTPEKGELARRHGCDETVLSSDPDLVSRVRDLSGGGVAAVYDSVGQATFFQSLDCLRRHGTMVTYGNASGPVEPFSPMELARRGSLFLTRPVLFDFIATPESLADASGALFAALAAGHTSIAIHQRWPLRQAATAHRELEARRTVGASVLLP